MSTVTPSNPDAWVIECDCGQTFPITVTPGETAEELAHYVWAVRLDGSRSNLGYCPITRGLAAAHAQARSTWGRSVYLGEFKAAGNASTEAGNAR